MKNILYIHLNINEGRWYFRKERKNYTLSDFHFNIAFVWNCKLVFLLRSSALVFCGCIFFNFNFFICGCIF